MQDKAMPGAAEANDSRRSARMTIEEQQKQMEADKKRRQADLEVLTEVTTMVPALVQGYDYSRAIDLLRGTRLETTDVRNALDGRLYLYTQSSDFVRQVTADLMSRGWNGTISRREGKSPALRAGGQPGQGRRPGGWGNL